MYKYTNSQLPATFNNYFKLISDFHSYNTRQIKTGQFALPKTCSNSGAKMIKYSAIGIWSRISALMHALTASSFSAKHDCATGYQPV